MIIFSLISSPSLWETIFSPRFSNFPSSSIHIHFLYLHLAVSYRNNSVSRQSLTWQGLAAMVTRLIWQTICLGTCFCHLIVLAVWIFFALKTRHPSTNPEHSRYPTTQTKQAKSSLNNMTFEKSYQQNSLNQGPLHSSAYLSSQSVKQLLDCMIRILNISHCPCSKWSYWTTEELLQSKTFLLTTTRPTTSNILSSMPGYTLCSIVYQLSTVWKKHL